MQLRDPYKVLTDILWVYFSPCRGCQERLGTARSHAVAYEEAVHRLLPWVPDMLSHLQGLGACPTEPEAVEQRKNKIEVSSE